MPPKSRCESCRSRMKEQQPRRRKEREGIRDHKRPTKPFPCSRRVGRQELIAVRPDFPRDEGRTHVNCRRRAKHEGGKGRGLWEERPSENHLRPVMQRSQPLHTAQATSASYLDWSGNENEDKENATNTSKTPRPTWTRLVVEVVSLTLCVSGQILCLLCRSRESFVRPSGRFDGLMDLFQSPTTWQTTKTVVLASKLAHQRPSMPKPRNIEMACG